MSSFEQGQQPSRALGTISHEKLRNVLRNVRKSQKCTEVSEMYLKTLLCKETVQKVRKSNTNQSDNGETDRPTNIVTYRVTCTQLKRITNLEKKLSMLCRRFIRYSKTGDEQTDRQTAGHVDQRTDGPTDRGTNGQMDRRTNGSTDK